MEWIFIAQCRRGLARRQGTRDWTRDHSASTAPALVSRRGETPIYPTHPVGHPGPLATLAKHDIHDYDDGCIFFVGFLWPTTNRPPNDVTASADAVSSTYIHISGSVSNDQFRFLCLLIFVLCGVYDDVSHEFYASVEYCRS